MRAESEAPSNRQAAHLDASASMDAQPASQAGQTVHAGQTNRPLDDLTKTPKDPSQFLTQIHQNLDEIEDVESGGFPLNPLNAKPGTGVASNGNALIGPERNRQNQQPVNAMSALLGLLPNARTMNATEAPEHATREDSTILHDKSSADSPSATQSKDWKLAEAMPLSSANQASRVRFHYVMPEDQEGMLRRSDSHHPPLPGVTFPLGNIPASALEELTAKSQDETTAEGVVSVSQEQSTGSTHAKQLPQHDAATSPKLSGFAIRSEPTSTLQTDPDSPIEGWEPTPTPPLKRQLLSNSQELPPSSSFLSPKGPSTINARPLSAPNNEKDVESRSENVALSDDDEVEVVPHRTLPPQASNEDPTRHSSSSSPLFEPEVPCSQSPPSHMSRARDPESGDDWQIAVNLSSNKPAPNKPSSKKRPSDHGGRELQARILEDRRSVSQQSPIQRRQRVAEASIIPNSDPHEPRSSSAPSPSRDLFPDGTGTRGILHPPSKRRARATSVSAAPPRKMPRLDDTAFSPPPSQNPAIEGREAKRAFIDSLEQDLYDDFCNVYPKYNGTEYRFRGACTKLTEAMDRLPESYFDDYIIKYPQYLPYLENMAKANRNPIRYEDFYFTLGKPKSLWLVVSRNKLREYLGKPIERKCKNEVPNGPFAEFAAHFANLITNQHDVEPNLHPGWTI